MGRQDFENCVSIRLIGSDATEFRCSAILEQDPGYLKWNRISLIGDRDAMRASHRLATGGVLRWELHNNPTWPHGTPRPDQHITSGTAALRSIGMASGIAIADDTIQKFGDLRIIELKERTTSPDWTDQKAEFWFLQRPRDWHPYQKTYRQTVGLIRRGDWLSVKGTDLKFRLVAIGYPRQDIRISRETELLDIPAIEIRHRGDGSLPSFSADAADLWFSLRILIAFRFRQYPATVAEFHESVGVSSQTWHPVEIQPRALSDRHEDPPFFGGVDQFFAKSASVLIKYKAHREILHAAAFGYANSFVVPSLEGGLTSCVEAIERLVSTFESVMSLERQAIGKKRWRKIAEHLKKTVDSLDLNDTESGLVKRGLMQPITLSLQDRILRMAEGQKKRWDAQDYKLLSDLDAMITARNAIVHGRLVDDVNKLYVETIKARVVFERLFLNFVGGHGFRPSAYPHMIIADFEERRAISAS